MSAHRLTTPEVQARLGVKAATVYAYVSRGLLHPERGPGGSTFDRREVDALAARSRRARAQGAGARELSFATSVTVVEDGALRYRGHDVVDLSRRASYEAVAALLLTGRLDAAALGAWQAPAGILEVAGRAGAALPRGATPVDRLGVALAAAATADPLRHDRTSPGPAAVAIVGAMVASLPCLGRAAPAGAGIAAQLWPRLTPVGATPARVGALGAVLVLTADHELAASTLAARVAAAFEADPYSVVLAGLATASGALHFGASAEVRAMVDDAVRRGPGVAVGARLARGERVPGFGMVLHPSGDPRGAELLRRLPDVAGSAAVADAVEGILALGTQRGFPPPNLDFGLGALEAAVAMVPGAMQAVCTLARVAGWLAHAAEEYEQRSPFRVRGTYVGPDAVPAATDVGPAGEGAIPAGEVAGSAGRRMGEAGDGAARR